MEKIKFSPESRQSGKIDPKLIIIATEGACSEKKYFEELRFQKGKANIHVEVLNTMDSKSSPTYVLGRLDSFKRKYTLKKGRDELWMVIDVDRWGSKKLSLIAQQCEQKNYHLAVSNPCFELWLLLHHKSLDEFSQNELDLFRKNPRINNKTTIEKELIRVCGRYSKSNLISEDYIPYIEKAIREAERIDDLQHRWPQNLGTRVYLLAKAILKPSYII